MELDVQGQWWLPGSEEKVYGVLTFSDDTGGRLELDGTFRGMLDSAEWSTNPGGSRVGVVSPRSKRNAGSYPRILGTSNREGKVFTLTDSAMIRTGSKSGFAHSSESIIVNQVLEGLQFDEPSEQIQFDGCHIAIRHLTRWVGLSGIEIDYPMYRDDSGSYAVITAKWLPLEEVALSDGTAVALRQILGQRGDELHSSGIEQSFRLTLRLPELRIPGDIIRVAGDVQDLVSIACDRPSEFLNVELLHPNSVVRTMDGKSQDSREPVKLYSQWLVKENQKLKRSLTAHDLFYSFEDIGGLPGVQSWIEVAQKNQTALARVMSVIYGHGTFIQDKLGNCLASLEWLDSSRRRDNVQDYAVRLRRCAALAGDPFTGLVGDVESWIRLAVDYRNDISHHYDKLFRNSTAEIYPMMQSAFWLFVLCMFRMADFPDSAFEKIADHQNFRWIGEQLRESWS